eukprot:1160515-Pelagomonas_calceolata.AAC.13
MSLSSKLHGSSLSLLMLLAQVLMQHALKALASSTPIQNSFRSLCFWVCFNLRVAPEDMELGGYSIKKGEKLWVPVISVHNSVVNFTEVCANRLVHALNLKQFITIQVLQAKKEKKENFM